MALAKPTFSQLLNDASKWLDPNPDYGTLLQTIGNDRTGVTSATVRTAILNIAQRSPVALAFVLDSDPDFIYVGHTPRVYPQDLTGTTPMDNLVVVHVGDDPDSCLAVVLPNNAFARTTHTHIMDVPTIVGAAGHGAAPPVLRTGPHAGTTAGVSRQAVQRCFLIPCAAAGDALSIHPDGRFTMASFYTEFVDGKYDDADATVAAIWEPLSLFFRGASTIATAGGTDNLMAVTPVQPGNLPAQSKLAAFSSRVVKEAMARLGVGGPQLSNFAFNQGVIDLKTTLEETAANALQYQRDAKNKSFEDKHGSGLQQLIYRYCNVTTDAALPESHRLLLQAPKNKEYALLRSFFAERAEQTPLPISTINAPLPTPALVDHVFRSYTPSTNGLTLGSGLTPFAIVCDGHSDMAEIKALIKKAELVEGGTSMSLNDASTLTSNDTALPTEVFVAIEKLCGWSVVVDVFHGAPTLIATYIRNAVAAVIPHLNRLVYQTAETQVIGMELVNRVLFEFQQDYYSYLNELGSSTTPNTVTVPQFRRIVDAVSSHRAASLCTLPASWYIPLQTSDWKTVSEKPKSSRELSGTALRVNPKADQAILARFKNCGHSSIGALLQGHEVDVPKNQGAPICLTWALKGACSNGCKRKDQHKTYSRTINQAIHALLDTCGVTNPQP
jgi:hypothetical protein